MSEQSPQKPDQATYWNKAGGQAWVDLQALMDRTNKPIENVLVDRAFPGAGRQVLDVGCGAGATTIAMARRLGPDGFCLGVDISEPLVAVAERQAAAAGLANAQFVRADAQTHDLGAQRFDAVMSRFGVMFFADFDAAFSNLRRGTRPGGELVFACWRSPAENPMAQVPATAAAHLLPPPPPGDPDAPGRFAFARRERIQGVLERSGWRDISIEPLDAHTPVTLEDAMTIGLRMGPLGAMLQNADEDLRGQVRDAVEAGMQAHMTDGMVQMTAACWLVTAKA